MSTPDQSALPGFEPNRERYARLSEPFESMDEANEALEAFRGGVEALREEHGVAEFVGAAAGTYLTPDGEVSDFIVPIQFGDAIKAEGIAAWLYGKTAADREALVARLLRQGKRPR